MNELVLIVLTIIIWTIVFVMELAPIFQGGCSHCRRYLIVPFRNMVRGEQEYTYSRIGLFFYFLLSPFFLFWDMLCNIGLVFSGSIKRYKMGNEIKKNK